MKDKIMKILIAVVIIEVLLLTVGTVFAMFGLFGFNTGCVYRYDLNNGASSATDNFSKTMSIRADGNYTTDLVMVDGVKTVVRNPNKYGEWRRANLNLLEKQDVEIDVDGTVSLCLASLPINNIASNTNTYFKGNTIIIPRVEDTNSEPLTLIFDANTEGWRNLLELYTGDVAEVILKDNRSSASSYNSGAINNVIEPNIFTGQSVIADCSEGKTTYSPICGRWSMWNGGQGYVSQCNAVYGAFSICGSHCCHSWGGTCWDWASGGSPCYNSCWKDTAVSASLPLPYKENGSVTIANGADILAITKEQCIPAAACNADPTTCINKCVADPDCANQCDAVTCQDACTACGTEYTSCTVSCGADAACNSACAAAKATCLDGSASVDTCKTECTQNAPICLTNCQKTSIDTCKIQCQEAAVCSNVQCSANDPQVTLCKSLKNNITDFNNKISNYKYWFSARDAGGLKQRLNATSDTSGTDTDGIWATIQDPAKDFSPNQFTGRKIYSAQNANNTDVIARYLQYRFYGTDHKNYTGGYVLQVRQTKCRRVKGEAISDTTINRGQILYVVSDGDPNQDATISAKAQDLPKVVSGKAKITTQNKGDLWFKIKNDPKDYPNSFGEYRFTLSYNEGRNSFVDKVLTPLLTLIKKKVTLSGMEIFQNLLCLKKDGGTYVHDTISGSCSNFFSYIKAMLTLYIMTYGIMFLTGIVKASYQDVVIRVVKVGIVAGLLSGQTFLWFNDTIFNFVVGFTDQIIANFGGFNNISSVNNVNNAAAPFMFLNTIFTKIFFSQTFLIQLLAVMGIGMVGIVYFVIVGAALLILVLVCVRAIAVYIIAMVATAFLLSLAPIFLTFMLFEQTYYLFESWYKSLFRYMIEPVILMIGIIVLTQIFTLYIDNVLSYSACWKCALSFYIPFTGILPLPGLENIPLFCIYWFGPWGLDNSGSMGQLGMDLSAMLGLVIIAFTMYGYSDLAEKIAHILTSAGVGSPSSIGGGVGMAQALGQKALRRVGLDDQTQAQLKQDKLDQRYGNKEKKILGSRNALLHHEQEVIAKEKKLGVYESDTSKALRKGMAGLKVAKEKIQALPDDIKETAGDIKDTIKSLPGHAKALPSNIGAAARGMKDAIVTSGRNLAGSANDAIHGVSNSLSGGSRGAADPASGSGNDGIGLESTKGASSRSVSSKLSSSVESAANPGDVASSPPVAHSGVTPSRAGPTDSSTGNTPKPTSGSETALSSALSTSIQEPNAGADGGAAGSSVTPTKASSAGSSDPDSNATLPGRKNTVTRSGPGGASAKPSGTSVQRDVSEKPTRIPRGNRGETDV